MYLIVVACLWVAQTRVSFGSLGISIGTSVCPRVVLVGHGVAIGCPFVF